MSETFRVGLLQAGYVNPEVARDHGDYPELFESLLAGTGFEITVYDLQRSDVPNGPGSQDGWIISGSASSAYDDEPWIRDLEDFCRKAMAAEAPLVGICFGHQVLARAMGGRVEKAPIGWGVGVHAYDLTGPDLTGPDLAWLDPRPTEVAMVASHQDQVTVLPDGAELWLQSDFCPNAGYTLGPNAMTMQAHPEFGTGLSESLLEVRREIIGEERVAEAEASLDRQPDSRLVAGWIGAFLTTR